jgi:hypothetical protein
MYTCTLEKRVINFLGNEDETTFSISKSGCVEALSKPWK